MKEVEEAEEAVMSSEESFRQQLSRRRRQRL